MCRTECNLNLLLKRKQKELAKIAIDEKIVSAIRFIDQRMDPTLRKYSVSRQLDPPQVPYPRDTLYDKVKEKSRITVHDLI